MASDSFWGFMKVLETYGATAASPSATTATDPFTARLAQFNASAAQGGVNPLAGISATGLKADAPPSFVWMGKRIDQKPNPNYADSAQYQQQMAESNMYGAGGRVGVTPDAAANLPFTWNDKEREEAYKRVGDAVGQPIQSLQQFNSIWANAVKTAEQSWAATEGGKKGSPLTVWDVFDLAKREGSKYGYAGGSGGSGGGGGTTVSTSSSVEKLSDGTMWQILKDTASQALGRAPTNDELQRFASRANQVASENPTKSRTVTTSGAGGSSSKTSTQQGASAGDYALAAEDMVNANPETGAYQAATTYADALFRGIASPV